MVFEQQAGAQAALDAQPHFISGTNVYLTNFVKPQKTLNQLPQDQPVWTSQQSWLPQQIHQESGSPSPKFQTHPIRNRYSSSDSGESDFEPVSNNFLEQPFISNDSQSDPQAFRHFEKSVKLCPVLPTSMKDFGLTHSELQNRDERQVQDGFQSNKVSSMYSEPFHVSPQQRLSLVIFNSSQLPNHSSRNSEMHVLQAVNLKGSSENRLFFCKKLEIEDSRLNLNLRFNIESKKAFLRRTSRWLASIQN